MKTESGSMPGARGVTLHTVVWSPEDEPAIDLVLAHGYGEHSGRYEPVAELFTEHGMRVWALDHRGHGRTTGVKRGVVDSFEALVDDLSGVVDRAKASGAGTERPLFLYGHSMGGLAVTRLAERGDAAFAGVIASSSALKPAPSIPTALVTVGNVLGKVAPDLPAVGLDKEGISRDQAVKDDYAQDDLNYRGKLTAGTGRQLNIAMTAGLAEAPKITCPLLIMHGTADTVTPAEGSLELFERVESEDCTLHLWRHCFHELHHEPEKGDVFELVFNWIDARR